MPAFQHAKVATLALANAIPLLFELFPKGKLKGEEFCVGSIEGGPGESLKINVKKGVWKDFNGAGLGGRDIISLIAAKDRISYAEAAAHLRERFGSTRTAQHDPRAGKREAALAEIPVPDSAPPPPLILGMAHPNAKLVGYVLVDYWAYRDVNGSVAFYVARYENARKLNKKGKPEKVFTPLAFFGAEGWRWKGWGRAYNPLYGLEELAAQPDAPVLIVEGERTAKRAAVLFPEFVVVTWPGGTGQLAKADCSVLTGRTVTYWPDADEGGQGSIIVVKSKLAAAGVRSLRVVELPSDLPPGWDLADEAPPGLDVLALVKSAAACDLTEERLFQNLELAQLVSCLVFNVGTEQFIHADSDRRFTKAQIDALYLHKQQRTAQRLLSTEQLAKVQRLAYLPGDHRRIVTERGGLTALNLWRPSHIKPERGDSTPFQDHLRYLCPTEEEFDHLVKMLAHMVQRPGTKLKSAIVLVGKQGTGKSLLGHVMRAIIGPHNTGVVESTQIKSAFNDYIEAVQLVIVEEIMALGRMEITNHLKPLITQTIVTINVKHVKAYEIENFANFLFLSNSEEALRIENDDRRYFIITSDAFPRTTDYYRALWQWIDANFGVILDWLLSIDLSAFSPDARPPVTEGKRRMVEAGRDELEAWLAELIDEGLPPFKGDLVELADVRLVLRDQASGSRFGPSFTRPAMMKALKAVGAKNLGQKKAFLRGQMVRRSLWAVRGGEAYERMSGQALIDLHDAGHTTRSEDGSEKPEIPL